MTCDRPSHRAEILLATLARLRTIQRVTGYRTDAGLSVIVGALTLGPDDPFEAICLLPARTTPLGSPIGEHVAVDLPLQIAGVARVSSWQEYADAWLRSEAMIADVIQAMETEDRTLGGLVHGDLRRGDVEPIERDGGAMDVGMLVTYHAPYRTAWGGI